MNQTLEQTLEHLHFPNESVSYRQARNALLEEEGMEEGRAIRIAIARAKTWATHHSDHHPSRHARK